MSADPTPLAGLRSDLDTLRRRLAEREPRFGSPPMELLRCVLESAPDYIGMLAPDGTILFVNRVREGSTLDRVIGTSAYDYQAPADRAAYRACVERVVRTGKPNAIDAVANLSNGRIARFETRFGPVRDGNQVIAVSIIATDVTANRQAMQALRESQAKLRMAVDTAGVGLWSWDIRTDHVAWEDTLCALFGLPPGTVPAGREGFLTLIHPDDRQHAAEGIARGVAAGEWEDEYRIVRADGAVRWVIAKGTVVNNATGGIALGSIIDVTDRRQRDELQRQAQKLEAVGQLTAGIAHNFNNMLMGILPYLEIAARSAPPDIAPLLRAAEHSALRAADLVRQLMTYAGRDRPAARTVEAIDMLVERAVAICRTTFDRRITFDVRCEGLGRARVDVAQLEQALLNLLINSRDALAEAAAPRIVVQVDIVSAHATEIAGRPDARDVDHVRVRIGDNGVGMDAATLARVYEPFFTTKDVGKGTGLGLATTHAIVREHGGYMTCESERGIGTTFSIYLASDKAVTDELGKAPAPKSARGTETVLIIDDEPAIRDVVSRMLEAAGFTAKRAASGPEALDLLADARVASEVALVLLDVSMPGMPARDLRNRLREIAPRARIVYFTGYAFEATDADDVVLEKPVTEARLLGTIRDVLDRTGAAH